MIGKIIFNVSFSDLKIIKENVKAKKMTTKK